jgi:hypothetical protein
MKKYLHFDVDETGIIGYTKACSRDVSVRSKSGIGLAAQTARYCF